MRDNIVNRILRQPAIEHERCAGQNEIFGEGAGSNLSLPMGTTDGLKELPDRQLAILGVQNFVKFFGHDISLSFLRITARGHVLWTHCRRSTTRIRTRLPPPS